MVGKIYSMWEESEIIVLLRDRSNSFEGHRPQVRVSSTGWGQTLQKCWRLEQKTVYERGQVVHTPTTPKALKGFSTAFLKASEGGGCKVGVHLCAGFLLVDAEETGQSVLPPLRCQRFWGLYHHHVVNFFHLVVAFSIWKTWDICMRCCYLGTSESSYSRRYGGTVFPQKASQCPAWLHKYRQKQFKFPWSRQLLTEAPTNFWLLEIRLEAT